MKTMPIPHGAARRDAKVHLHTPTRICTASGTGTYRTGDGEVRQQVRPGAMHAYTLPTRGYRT